MPAFVATRDPQGPQARDGEFVSRRASARVRCHPAAADWSQQWDTTRFQAGKCPRSLPHFLLKLSVVGTQSGFPGGQVPAFVATETKNLCIDYRKESFQAGKCPRSLPRGEEKDRDRRPSARFQAGKCPRSLPQHPLQVAGAKRLIARFSVASKFPGHSWPHRQGASPWESSISSFC